MRKTIIFLLVGILSTNLAFAQSPVDSEALNQGRELPPLTRKEKLELTKIRYEYRLHQIRSSELYQDTFKYCRGENPTFALKYAGAGMGQVLSLTGLSLMEIGAIYRNRGLSQGMKDLLSKDEFYQALEDCYPGDDLYQGWVIFSLLAEDSFGKLLAASLFAKLLAAQAHLVKEYPRFFRNLKYLSYGMTALPLATLGYSVAQAKLKDPTRGQKEDIRSDIIQRMDTDLHNTSYLLFLAQKSMEAQPDSPKKSRRLERIKLALWDLKSTTGDWQQVVDGSEEPVEPWTMPENPPQITLEIIQEAAAENKALRDGLIQIQQALQERLHHAVGSTLPLVSGAVLTSALIMAGKTALATEAGKIFASAGSRLLALELGSVAIGVSFGKYKANRWYRLKKEEIQKFVGETSNALSRLEAADRGLRTLQLMLKP